MLKLSPNQLEEMDFSDDDYNIDTKQFIPPVLENQPEKIQRAFNILLNKNKNIFAFDLLDLKEPCPLETLQIDTISEKPLVTPPYRRAIREHVEIDLEIQKLLKAGFISPSNSISLSMP